MRNSKAGRTWGKGQEWAGENESISYQEESLQIAMLMLAPGRENAIWPRRLAGKDL